MQGTPGTSDAAQPLLQVRGAFKSFGPTKALRNVDLEIYPGEVVALLGENGAGKSTLIKSLAGVHGLDHGELRFDGIQFNPSDENPGMSFIHQDHGLIEWMTVAENICLYLGYPRKRWQIDRAEADKRAAEALKAVGASIDPDTRIRNLNRAERSIVAISRALLARSKILVLDEPTASLPADDVTRLFAVLRALRARGMGMIYVSHRLDEVFEIADRMIIMRDGEVVGRSSVQETTQEEAINLIVGGAPESLYFRTTSPLGPVKLRIHGISSNAAGVSTASFAAGEVVGLVGLRGAGQERLGRLLFGLEKDVPWEVELDGVSFSPNGPPEAIQAGICLAWGDRGSGSTFAGMSIRENLFMNCDAAGAGSLSLISPRSEGQKALELGHRLHLRPNQPELAIEALSGGNQQKVVIGRWLHLRGKVYIFEDPTAGVDVGARAEIYKLIQALSETGAVVIVVSSDFEEVEHICHRAYVFDSNRIVAELSGTDVNMSRLLSEASANLGRAEK